MKIGLDGLALQGNLTGVGNYYLGIVESLYKEISGVEFIVFTHKAINCLSHMDRVKIVQDKTMFSFVNFDFSIIWMFLFMVIAVLPQKTY
jgi:hypothetical protein